MDEVAHKAEEAADVPEIPAIVENPVVEHDKPVEAMLEPAAEPPAPEPTVEPAEVVKTEEPAPTTEEVAANLAPPGPVNTAPAESSDNSNNNSIDDEAKRKRESESGDTDLPETKKVKTEGGEAPVEGASLTLDLNPAHEPEPVPASTEGTTIFNDADVLSGRGGGTNVHPGNRNFRDMINLHRRAYLKARKNDKPAISRAIVRSIRENNGRFLKKEEKSGLWFEIGDDAAREKTSQALRQRAPEMRKLLFDTEREEARAAAEEHMRQHRMMMAPPGMSPEMMANMPQMPMGPGGMPMFPNPFFPGMPPPPPGPAGGKGNGNGKNGGAGDGSAPHPGIPPYPMFPFMAGPMPFPPPPMPGGTPTQPQTGAAPQPSDSSEGPQPTKRADC